VTHDIATYAAILMDGNTITNLLKNKIALRRFSARFSCGLSLSTSVSWNDVASLHSQQEHRSVITTVLPLSLA
jgi:hypothetical protein